LKNEKLIYGVTNDNGLLEKVRKFFNPFHTLWLSLHEITYKKRQWYEQNLFKLAVKQENMRELA
jgi:predicted nuclease of predicted toxin-antitoxin system